MSDEVDQRTSPAESVSGESDAGKAPLSRRKLLKTGGAAAAGAGLAGLVGAGGAQAKPLPLPFVTSPTKGPLKISLNGTTKTLAAAINQANAANQYAASGVLEAALQGLIISNPAVAARPGFTLDFSLHFTLFGAAL
jgi:hypothetical protein